MSNAQFKINLAAMVRRAKGNTDLVVRGTALRILRSVVEKSPVDTGRFRGNWFVQEANMPILSDSLDKDGSSTIAAGMEEIARFKIGDKFYILNHLPYSVRLEYGYSAQAPQGMVRITVEEFQTYLRESAAEVAR